jgi:hypothetical protein
MYQELTYYLRFHVPTSKVDNKLLLILGAYGYR